MPCCLSFSCAACFPKDQTRWIAMFSFLHPWAASMGLRRGPTAWSYADYVGVRPCILPHAAPLDGKHRIALLLAAYHLDPDIVGYLRRARAPPAVGESGRAAAAF